MKRDLFGAVAALHLLAAPAMALAAGVPPPVAIPGALVTGYGHTEVSGDIRDTRFVGSNVEARILSSNGLGSFAGMTLDTARIATPSLTLNETLSIARGDKLARAAAGVVMTYHFRINGGAGQELVPVVVHESASTQHSDFAFGERAGSTGTLSIVDDTLATASFGIVQLGFETGSDDNFTLESTDNGISKKFLDLRGDPFGAASTSFDEDVLTGLKTNTLYTVNIELSLYDEMAFATPVPFGGTTLFSLAVDPTFRFAPGFDAGPYQFEFSEGFGGGPVVVPAPGVPEPATWALTLVGFGLMGAALRRRKPGAFAASL